jgi:hypothetical protein
MPFTQPLSRPTDVGASRALLAVFLTMGLVWSAMADGTAHGADSAPPSFELPFACGETWWGATYATHSRYHAVDFNTFNGDAWELNHPVLASAAGTVATSDYQSSGAGNRVIIDHGGGWQTVYYHLASRVVSVGQEVARGTPIGGAGGTPSYPVHLHYEQRLEQLTVPAVFGGAPFVYTEFDLANGYQGLPVVSGNCDPPPTPCAGFTDLDRGSVFCDAVEWLVGTGVTTGYADGAYRPTAPVTRQSMAAFLWRMAGSPAATPAVFPDVDPSGPFAVAIGWLVETGVTTGFADGSFRPTEPVTRQSMAAFLWRLAGSPAATPAVFPDVDPSSEFAAPVGWLVTAGVTTGYADGSFRPTEPVTRQSMAAFLWRYGSLGTEPAPLG